MLCGDSHSGNLLNSTNPVFYIFQPPVTGYGFIVHRLLWECKPNASKKSGAEAPHFPCLNEDIVAGAKDKSVEYVIYTLVTSDLPCVKHQ